ncbi:Flagellar hook-basal body complex protein FliE [Vibrio stylophorae]|uniref:Flagellar hook-basal body complex protein FliE n=1 Tax=Vibrio stylophorae TaxID=659351 RepID=A0ABM8ZUW4_9VIBR|nr:flagellar hook-basal body complex protein FliE [Vibrio stylophorae]CAH0534114.1 Flagellar hook-basal body complex protein FliE [Vibrio stylophorae]
MKVQNLQQEMQAMKLAAGSQTVPVTGQQVSETFANLLNQAVNNVNSLQQSSSDLATRFDQGDRTISLADVMIARNKAGVAFDATVQVRNKLVEAYKEIMSMPV